MEIRKMCKTARAKLNDIASELDEVHSHNRYLEGNLKDLRCEKSYLEDEVANLQQRNMRLTATADTSIMVMYANIACAFVALGLLVFQLV